MVGDKCNRFRSKKIKRVATRKEDGGGEGRRKEKNFGSC
jgi:hypothetical protein